MKILPMRQIGEFIEERTDRLGQGSATIYSVTNENGFVRSLDLFDKQVFSANTANYKRVEFFDLAFNPSRINVGSIALCEAKEGGAVSPMYSVIRCKPGLLPSYLLRFLKSDEGLNQIRHRCEGAVRFQLKFRDLCAIPIFVPPPEEQERLAGLLDEAYELRKLRTQADSRSAALISALFHQMFGDPASLNNRWPIVPLKSLGKVTTGNTPPRKNKEFYGDFIEWIKTNNIDATRGIITKAAEGLSEEGARWGRIVPAGTVLITCIAGSRQLIGNAAITDRAVAINQQINAITPNTNTDSAFLCQQIGTLKSVIQKRATGVMTGIINKSILESIPVICPPLLLQTEFGIRVAEIRALEDEQAASRLCIDAMLQSLLHRAFNGEL